ncbi:MAG TPA: transketolase C-terminal domain-containing protein, partial [Spirillospora sp.]|nr:transketolase C-terminal domain-containing protein [Spirillospora sp.]
DAKGLLLAAIDDDNPVMFFEHKLLYNTKGDVPAEPYRIPLGQTHRVREGRHVTVVATSIMVSRALEAAETLAQEGIELEIFDPRTLRPFDDGPIIKSVKKTGRVLIVYEAVEMGGFGGEVAARIAGSEAFDYLEAPVRRLAGKDVPMPQSRVLEYQAVPQVESIVTEGRKLARNEY